MRKKRIYSDYVNDILTAVDDTDAFTKGMSFKRFIRDRKTTNAVVRSLEILGEAAKNLPAEIKVKNPDIPWNKIIGLRNRIAHEYFNIDLNIVWKIIKEELPALKPYLKKLPKK